MSNVWDALQLQPSPVDLLDHINAFHLNVIGILLKEFSPPYLVATD